MIKYLLLVLLTLLTYSCSNNPLNQSDQTEETGASTAQRSGDGYDFRAVKWGMSKEEVMQSEEGEPIFKSDTRINYTAQTMGLESRIGYTFNSDDELIRGNVFVLWAPEDKNKYIENYKKIQKEFKKKYGKTSIDTVQHKDPSQNIDPESAEAVCNGQLLYATQWDLPESSVQLLLRGQNSECVITMTFVSKEGLRQLLKDRESQEQ